MVGTLKPYLLFKAICELVVLTGGGVVKTLGLCAREKRVTWWNFHYLIFTVHKRSCRKVMFSQACVKISVHGGGVYPSMHWCRHPTPQQMATAADGMHPTGIHSCFKSSRHTLLRMVF